MKLKKKKTVKFYENFAKFNKVFTNSIEFDEFIEKICKKFNDFDTNKFYKNTTNLL